MEVQLVSRWECVYVPQPVSMFAWLGEWLPHFRRPTIEDENDGIKLLMTIEWWSNLHAYRISALIF